MVNTLACRFWLKSSENIRHSKKVLTSPSKNTNTQDTNNIRPNHTQINPSLLFVSLGNVSVIKGRLEIDGDFWRTEADEYEIRLYRNKTLEIDLINCAGYIASATLEYRVSGSMRVKLIDKSIVKDFKTKVKNCAVYESNNVVSSDVFGVYPKKENRKSTIIKQVNIKKLYASVTRDKVQLKRMKKIDELIAPKIRFKKRALSLRDDNWTDLDGDGEIDLIKYYDAPCLREKDTCTWLFRFINGRWTNIGYVAPA